MIGIDDDPFGFRIHAVHELPGPPVFVESPEIDAERGSTFRFVDEHADRLVIDRRERQYLLAGLVNGADLLVDGAREEQSLRTACPERESSDFLTTPGNKGLTSTRPLTSCG